MITINEKDTCGTLAEAQTRLKELVNANVLFITVSEVDDC